MVNDEERAAMRRALDLARSPGVPLGPNPRVGAVVLDRAGSRVGEGYHHGAGSVHAEVAALRSAGARARGGTVIVTLEPCNHTGRTGPCAEALIDSGVARVVFGQGDPNPVATGGAARLKSAGVEVEGGLLAEEAAKVNQVWTFAMRHRRPLVTWKFAATLDGRSAAADGTSMWITGPAARTDVHRLRGLCDAIVVGTGTVETDNPRLTVRDAEGVPWPVDHQPLRAIMGLRDLEPTLHVFDDAAPTLRLLTRDPEVALAELFRRDTLHVWLEGGPTLAAAYLRVGLVDEIVAYVAPALLGSGSSAVPDLGIDTIDKAMRFELADVTRVGGDVRITMKGAR
jgi:diaminohydroxyphosphoribosylaminopyrimidine deaminase/5-amino-6-(5-phosphoribosylamino)uracil reductase